MGSAKRTVWKTWHSARIVGQAAWDWKRRILAIDCVVFSA